MFYNNLTEELLKTKSFDQLKNLADYTKEEVNKYMEKWKISYADFLDYWSFAVELNHQAIFNTPQQKILKEKMNKSTQEAITLLEQEIF